MFHPLCLRGPVWGLLCNLFGDVLINYIYVKLEEEEKEGRDFLSIGVFRHLSGFPLLYIAFLLAFIF
jgi:hypothetical protein